MKHSYLLVLLVVAVGMAFAFRRSEKSEEEILLNVPGSIARDMLDPTNLPEA
ncbi:hypothetical protein L1D54_22510 [Vibrio brasiliensis]|uniref:hypothetical protein n=1 Tax=Vibrio brasiliensis TaxID=170652 RepID=UPI001EFC9296|nr:hypothetical protein [Vibrio brasiliensis]MCG9753216.1 hypothetical protein [Vibrio brasiliensis]